MADHPRKRQTTVSSRANKISPFFYRVVCTEVFLTFNAPARASSRVTGSINEAGPDRTSAVLKKYATVYEENFSRLAFT